MHNNRTRFRIKTKHGVILFEGYKEGESVVVTYRGDYDAMFGTGHCFEKFPDIESVKRLTPTCYHTEYGIHSDS